MQWVVDAHTVSPSCVLAGDVKAIAAGYWHSIVLKTNGNVMTTGRNDHGQLGDGTWGWGTDKNRFAVVIGTWDIALGNTLLGLGLE